MSKHKVINNAKRFILTVVLLIAFIAFGVFLYYNSNLEAASRNGKEQEVTIPKGLGAKGVANTLKKQGIIKNADVFYFYSKLTNKAPKIQAGNYILSSSMTVPEIIDKLSSGRAKMNTVRFTIPEGFELRQIADRLAADGLVDKDKFYAAVQKADFKYEFIKALPDRENKLEGYLFPDTYEVYKNSSEQVILDRMLNRFDKVFTEKYRKRAEELNMSVDDVVILASIIEREAKLDSERKTISAVFHNRLKKNIRLQSCATVQYLLKEQKEVLTYKDLEVKSPYNTYMYEGLPKGPIASPGAKSIEAALYPEKVDYLYFVANKDGSHVFTKTYKEHLNAQNKIRH